MINKIVERKREEIKELKARMPLDKLKNKIRVASRGNLFRDALKKLDKISIIAELKKASPSKGLLLPDFDLLEVARLYEEGGVEAISVLTEKNFFKGELDYVRLLRKSIRLPILQKDFFIDEYQIYHAAYLGSDAILLITRILSKEEISAFMTLAKSLNIAVLTEVHDKADVEKVLPLKPGIIGINNRNLETLKVNLENTKKLRTLIPEDKNTILVSESGIKTRSDLIFLEKLGINAALIGETFMRSTDIKEKLKELRSDN